MIHLLLAVIYASFISLGLPDSLLGSAWPAMYPQLGVPVSYSGIVFMIISVGTIISSLQSDRLTRHLGTGKVTAFSVAMTAAALLGFSVSHEFWQLCLWAVPYGLGAGSVDASLNNYVALHYESRHMSWLHCMWGVGAAAGPYIMGRVITGGGTWNGGYRCIALIQVALTAVLLLSLPLWKGRPQAENAAGAADAKSLSVREAVKISGVKNVLICFFCYCALEQTTGLWASSYLTLYKGVPAETAASYASMFFIGITAGRALNGFAAMKLNDVQMVRMGEPYYCLRRCRDASAAGRGGLPCRTCYHRAWLRAGLPLPHPRHAGAFRCGQVTGGHRHSNGLRLCRNEPYAAAVRPDRRAYHGRAAAGVSACPAGADERHARGAYPQNRA